MFYPFSRKDDETVIVIIEAENHTVALTLAEEYGITVGEEEEDHWNDRLPESHNGYNVPTIDNFVIAEPDEYNYYWATGLAHGQVVFLNNEIIIY